MYKVPDPVPEIKITEVKDEICTNTADDTGQKMDDSSSRADDTRPSTLFNKATLLGNHSVDRNIPHDLSPLELIATVANDICIQEGRGLKRKTEDAQLYENDDDNNSTETRQLQKSIERAIDLCSSSNQGSPACSTGSSVTVSATNVRNTRTESNMGTVQEYTPNSSDTTIKSSNSESISASNVGSESSNNKVSANVKHGDKSTVGKEKPKKTDTASQCDPRPKKQKSDANSQSKSKNSNKIQTSVKDGKDAATVNVTEKKSNVKSDAKVTDKSVSLKANGVNIIEQNGASVSVTGTNSSASNVKVTDASREKPPKMETTKDQKSVPKTINLPSKDQNATPKRENDAPKPAVSTASSISQVIPNFTTTLSKTSNTVTKTPSSPSSAKSSCIPKTTSVQNKAQTPMNKVPATSAPTKNQNKLTSAQNLNKVPGSSLKVSTTSNKTVEPVKSVTQINGHSSPSEIAKQNAVKLNQTEKKD